MDAAALALSFRLAGLSTLILLATGLPLTFLLSRARGRWAIVAESLISLPLVLPPTVLGFFLLLLLAPFGLAFTFTGLLLASIVSGLPFAWQAFLSGFHALDPRWLETSWTLGESRAMTFVRVALPLTFPAIVSGCILAFAHALGEFGVVLMIGGNIPGVSRTISISLYDQVEAFRYHDATRTALFLLAVSFAALLSVTTLRRKTA